MVYLDSGVADTRGSRFRTIFEQSRGTEIVKSRSRAFYNTPCESTSCGVTRKNEFDECEAIGDDDDYDDDFDDDDYWFSNGAAARSAALTTLVFGAALAYGEV